MFPNAEYDAEMLLTLQVTKALLVQSWEEQPKPQWMKLCGSKKRTTFGPLAAVALPFSQQSFTR